MTKEKNPDVISSITERLEKQDQGAQDQGIGTKAATPNPVNILEMTDEDWRFMKAKMETTSSNPKKEKGNPIIELREFNDDYIVFSGNVYEVQETDKLTNITSIILMIPFRLSQDDEGSKPHVMEYRKFMTLPRKSITVDKVETKKREIVGKQQVFSQEYKTWIDQVMTIVDTIFTLTLNGKTFTINADQVN